MFNLLLGIVVFGASIITTAYARDFTKNGVHPWIILSIPLLITHPFVVAVLLFSGISAPTSFAFYLFFSLIVIISGIGTWLYFKGLTMSQFGACNSVLALRVPLVAVLAWIFIGEAVLAWQWFFVAISVTGVGLITWPKREDTKFKIDVGLVLVLGAVLLYSIGSIFFRKAALAAGNTWSLFLGRSYVDLVFLSLATFVLVPLIQKKKPIAVLSHFYSQSNKRKFIIIFSVYLLVEAYLFFVFPAATVSLIQTVIIPLAFFVGRKRYNELPPWRVIIGAVFVFTAVFGFILSG